MTLSKPESFQFLKGLLEKFRARRLETILSFVLIFVIVLVSSWLMFSTFGYKEGTFLLKGKVWSDFGAHIQMIRSFSMGDNFPPQYPTYSGPRISYHFLFYFLVGMMEKAGINLAFAINFLSASGFALLLGLIYCLGRLFFFSRLAGVLAVILFVFNGTLDFVLFFEKYPLSLHSFNDIVTAKEFISFGPWHGIVSAFWTLNIYTNQRHLALSYALVILFLLPLLRFSIEGKRPNVRALLAAALAGSLLPLLHKSIIPITAIYAFIWMVFNPKTIKPFGWFYVFLVLAGIPSSLYLRGESAASPVLQFGFLAESKTWEAWLRYWWFNMGLYCFIIPVLLVVMKKEGRIWILAGLILFVLSNTFRFTTEMFNNHKFLNFFILGIQIATAGWLVKLWRSTIPRKALAVVLFVGVTLSGVIDFFPVLNDRQEILKDRPKSEVIDWVAQNTRPHSIFLASVGFYNPANLAGRKLYLGYTYFPWSMGYPVFERERTVVRLFAPTLDKEALCRVLKIEGIDYVIIGPGPGDWRGVDTSESFIAKNWHSVYSSPEGFRIYAVSHSCEH